MPSIYLQPEDYATYGVPNATLAQVTHASVYIDAYLKRPEGLVWAPDFSGNPCYMSAAIPSATLTLAASIAPGANVQVAVNGPAAMLAAGEVLVCDQGDSNLVEPLTVIGGAPAGQLIFQNVLNPHSVGATLAAGLAITEQRNLARNRPIATVSRTPMVRLISGIGRYAYPRRGDAHAGNTDDFNLLAVYQTFGGPPAWEVWNPIATEFDSGSGQLWIPAGIMLAYYTEVRYRYVAGYAQGSIPTAIKMVCAKLVQTLANDPALGPVKQYGAGGFNVTLFADTLIAGDMRNDLAPYCARAMR